MPLMGILLSLPQRRGRTDYIGNLIYLSSYEHSKVRRQHAKRAGCLGKLFSAKIFLRVFRKEPAKPADLAF